MWYDLLSRPALSQNRAIIPGHKPLAQRETRRSAGSGALTFAREAVFDQEHVDLNQGPLPLQQELAILTPRSPVPK